MSNLFQQHKKMFTMIHRLRCVYTHT